MIIISKQKDFYDYCVGIYGRDEKKVLDRRGWPDTKPENLYPVKADLENSRDSYIVRYFAILNYRYSICYTLTGKIYFDKYEKNRRQDKKNNGAREFLTSLNIKYRQPFLMQTGTIFKQQWEPILFKDFDLNKLFKAEKIYQELDLFLGWLIDNPPVPDTQTNTEKIQSNGFDKRTSFRPKMKKK